MVLFLSYDALFASILCFVTIFGGSSPIKLCAEVSPWSQGIFSVGTPWIHQWKIFLFSYILGCCDLSSDDGGLFQHEMKMVFFLSKFMVIIGG